MRTDPAALRREVHRRVLRDAGFAPVTLASVRLVVDELAPLLGPDVARSIADEVMADVHGLGVLEPLLDDDAVTDVLISGRGVWVERSGVLAEQQVVLDDEEVMRLIERIVMPLGLRVDRASPMVDARLSDGSRVNVVLPPLALDGPCLSIRRFGARSVPLDELAPPPIASLLRDAVRERCNIIVSGGTGTGKTTVLNALAGVIDAGERIVTIEDTAELRLPLRHVVRLEARVANVEGAGRVTIGDLVRNALRMRPDRIIVGEVRGPEALDMLQAMNTGHEGSMSTCHANSPDDAVRRLETMVLMAGVDLPLPAIRQQILSSVDLVVHMRRSGGGRRIVSSVAEVVDVRGVPRCRRVASAASSEAHAGVDGDVLASGAGC